MLKRDKKEQVSLDDSRNEILDMQGRWYSTIVNSIEYLMTQQIEQDHFAFGEHSSFYILMQNEV